MGKYQVVLVGYQDPSAEGQRRFAENFRQAYNVDEAQVNHWIHGNNGIIYEYDDQASAEQSKQFLESIGGVVEIRGTAPVSVAPAAIASRPCPRCKKEVAGGIDECPHCGIFISKYEIAQARRFLAQSSPQPKAASASGTPELKIRTGKEVVKYAIEIFKANFVHYFILGLLSLVPAFIYGLIIGVVASAINILPLTIFLALVLLPLTFVPSNYCYITMMKITAEIMSGKEPTTQQTLLGLNFYDVLKFTATYLVTIIISGLPIAPITALMVLFIYKSMIGTSILFGIVAIIGMIAVSMFVMFSLPVFVFEGKWSIEAIKRSYELGKEYIWRNFGVIMLFSLYILVAFIVISIPLHLMRLSQVGGFIIQIALVPIYMIMIVVLYFDMLARKRTL